MQSRKLKPRHVIGYRSNLLVILLGVRACERACARVCARVCVCVCLFHQFAVCSSEKVRWKWIPKMRWRYATVHCCCACVSLINSLGDFLCVFGSVFVVSAFHRSIILVWMKRKTIEDKSNMKRETCYSALLACFDNMSMFWKRSQKDSCGCVLCTIVCVLHITEYENIINESTFDLLWSYWKEMYWMQKRTITWLN